MRISDWSSDVCSSDLGDPRLPGCHTQDLWSERIFIALPDRHLLASSRDITLQDVRGEVFLVEADAAGPAIEDYLVRRLSGPGLRPKSSLQREIVSASSRERVCQ